MRRLEMRKFASLHKEIIIPIITYHGLYLHQRQDTAYPIILLVCMHEDANIDVSVVTARPSGRGDCFPKCVGGNGVGGRVVLAWG